MKLAEYIITINGDYDDEAFVAIEPLLEKLAEMLEISTQQIIDDIKNRHDIKLTYETN